MSETTILTTANFREHLAHIPRAGSKKVDQKSGSDYNFYPMGQFSFQNSCAPGDEGKVFVPPLASSKFPNPVRRGAFLSLSTTQAEMFSEFDEHLIQQLVKHGVDYEIFDSPPTEAFVRSLFEPSVQESADGHPPSLNFKIEPLDGGRTNLVHFGKNRSTFREAPAGTELFEGRKDSCVVVLSGFMTICSKGGRLAMRWTAKSLIFDPDTDGSAVAFAGYAPESTEDEHAASPRKRMRTTEGETSVGAVSTN